MKKVLLSSSTILMLALTGCASQSAPTTNAPAANNHAAASETAAQTVEQVKVVQTDNIDSKVQVAYQCKANNNQTQKVEAMYGVKDNTLVVAQLKINDQVSPGLWRVVNDVNGDTQNSYFNNGVTWITDKATPANVTRTNGNMLMQTATREINGKQETVQNILLKYCTVDRAATNRLNRTHR